MAVFGSGETSPRIIFFFCRFGAPTYSICPSYLGIVTGEINVSSCIGFARADSLPWCCKSNLHFPQKEIQLVGGINSIVKASRIADSVNFPEALHCAIYIYCIMIRYQFKSSKDMRHHLSYVIKHTGCRKSAICKATDDFLLNRWIMCASSTMLKSTIWLRSCLHCSW